MEEANQILISSSIPCSELVITISSCNYYYFITFLYLQMMKQMYDEGDDDMKRTIRKSWHEAQSQGGGGGPGGMGMGMGGMMGMGMDG